MQNIICMSIMSNRYALFAYYKIIFITCKNKTKIYLLSFVLLDMQSLRSSCGLKSAYTGPDEKFCVFTPSSKTIKWGSCHHRIEVYAQSLTQWNNKINP